MHQRTFTMKDQQDFARISGDYNPLHMDEVAARRFLFGSPIVHGIHTVLWALDAWVAGKNHPIELISLSCYFKRGLAVNAAATLNITDNDDNSVTFELTDNTTVYASIKFTWKDQPLNRQTLKLNNLPETETCQLLNAKDMASAKGSLDICLDQQLTARLFPNLSKKFPLEQIAHLLSTTRLVGMHCPGLHSIYNKLDVEFKNPSSQAQTLNYTVAEFDERFSRAFINIESPAMTGTIISSLRPAPRKQINFSQARQLISSGEFNNQRAMVIGGSRGLGEVASQLLAAGGAKVLLSYFKGKDDAQNLVNEIKGGGGDAADVPFNVLSTPKLSIDEIIHFAPTHLYYFATPRILKSDSGREFSEELLKTFSDYYVTGFSDTVEYLLKNVASLRYIFYPSSIFVETNPAGFAEYVNAKNTGEALCMQLEKKHNNIRIYKPRLPQLATDQTSSLMAYDQKENPTPVILKHLRAIEQTQPHTVNKP